MQKPLRILHLEDDPDFIQLVGSLLRDDGLQAEVVPARLFREFTAALEREPYDLILADYSLPDCNGLQALQAARRHQPDTPVVLISGTIGEQAAIESLRCGATDYVLKNKMERLSPTVRRALHECQERAQRRRAETELVRREKYFRTLTENSLDVLTIVDRDCVFQYNSPSLKSVLGYEPAELAGRSAFDFIHPDDAPGARGAFEQTLLHPDMRITHRFRFRRGDGSWCQVETVCQNRLEDPEIAGVVINSRDITDRARVEAERLASQEQYRVIFDGSPTPMWIKDVETLRFLEVNEAAVQHYGYSREEFLSMSALEIRGPDEAERFTAFVQNEIRPQPISSAGRAGLWIHRKKDGQLIDVEIKWAKIQFAGRQAALVIANDITERKRAAEALEKSEASLAAAQRIAHLGSWELDLKNLQNVHDNELRWSDETFRIFGYQPREVAVSTALFFQAVHPDDRQRVADTFAEAVRKREIYDIEHRILLPGGEERVVRERAEVALDGNHRPVQVRGTVMDITERKRLEEQLRQSQKMEAIGQLAGGVAHDFNNILTVIHGHASLMMEDETLCKSGRDSAQHIAQATERAAGLTRQLLAFSRRQVMQPRRIDLNEVISDMTMMLGRILGEDISLQLNYSPRPAFVQADASMIEQVLLNLAVNARDAMPRGGRLAIRVTPVHVRAGRHPEARPGRFASLEVADNGCGIAPENLQHIFEPFFTTKEVGKGTGLGLATVYGVVKQHQGWIEVESEPGKGALFRVLLPVCNSSPGGRSPLQKIDASAVRGGTETVFVVEDEEPLRELVCSVLGGYGYKVLRAESGMKALEVWERHKQSIDLLLTDLVMPDKINGRELAEKLCAEKPQLRVIFTSGYSADVVGNDAPLQDHSLHYLQKPYDPQKLAVAVRECLDA